MSSFRHAMMGSAAVCAVMYALPAAAEVKSFDIPAQPARTAIPEFGRQSGIQILAAQTDVGNQQAPELKGDYEPREALDLLLRATNLRIASDDGRTVTLVQAPQGGSAGGGADANAVDALIVTAQKREENIQDVPIAISAFSQEDLTRSQVAGGPDLMTQVPNMTFTKTNFSSYSIQIRGIGTQAISATTDAAVAVAFNNTPFIRNRFFEQEFYDLQRVEVLRGPQGTLYGRNATAGVVNIVSAKPVHRFEAKLAADIANYKSSRLEGMVNIPLVEDVAALRIAGAWTKRDGYVKNLLTGEQTDGRDLWSTRVTLGLEPNDWLSVNLIWEHFEEDDDRLRTGKQLCDAHPGPSNINGFEVPQTAESIGNIKASYVSQGCQPASMYSPDSFNTPNGYALGYYGPLSQIGLPTFLSENPYVNTVQSQNLREIETHLTPEYTASSDLLELQVSIDLPGNVSLSSETGFNKDFIFSFSDFNRFDTTPDVFVPGGAVQIYNREDYTGPGDRLDIIDLDGFFCDPQLGCTNRLAAGDLSTAKSKQFSQEFRLSSDFEGPFNFNLGANFLRYDTEEKYYVFINTISMWGAVQSEHWEPGVTDNHECLMPDTFYGPAIADPSKYWSVFGCIYVDPNDIHHLNDQGRNYFLSKNPYHLLSYAAFGEAYYNITPELKLTAGFRWTVDKKTAPQIPTWLLAGPYGPNRDRGSSFGTPTYKVIEQDWREPTGRIALDWKPELSFTDDTLVYGSYVRGYKAGGANPPPPVLVLATQCPPECDPFTIDTLVNHYLTHPETFDPEYVDAYEFGTKNTVLDGRLTANLALFYYDYKGYQISQIVDRSAINFNFDAKIWGAELEVDWRPLENLRLGFKGGYENTRVADGMEAIDTMDRTAGKEGWMVFRPFPTMPSNCVIPIDIAVHPVTGDQVIPPAACSSYLVGVDPITFLPYVPNPTEYLIYPPPPGYPGYSPTNANFGQGFTKDLSGNQLPNAPALTATITADYTIPFGDWLATLHTDLYYQSEAWTRIFNTEGYDKLKAYNNINLAAIFTNEEAGWRVMAYIKNVLDRDSITGAFLNSDDTGLTTNIFLTEPRLYGIRVTKDWRGGPLIGSFGARRDGPYPLTIEFGSGAKRLDTPAEPIAPFTEGFSSALDPRRVQDEELDWFNSPELRLTYRPEGSAWKASVAMRYGRTSNDTGRMRMEEEGGPRVCGPSLEKYVIRKLSCDPEYGPVQYEFNGQEFTLNNKYNEDNWVTPINRVGISARHREEHLAVDFAVGKDVGLGFLDAEHSSVSAGLRYATFKASVSGEMNAVPDLNVPEGWHAEDSTFHHYVVSFEGEREFKGAGPTVTWEAAVPLWGDEESGHLNLDWAVTGGALFGKQKAAISGTQGADYFVGEYPRYDSQFDSQNWQSLPEVALTPMVVAPRSKSATVPVLDLSLGLSFEVPGVKLSTGYRWERYFDVLDAGFTDHKTYDRTVDGPYFKIAVGLGG